MKEKPVVYAYVFLLSMLSMGLFLSYLVLFLLKDSTPWYYGLFPSASEQLIGFLLAPICMLIACGVKKFVLDG